jgi:hypothetical protein
MVKCIKKNLNHDDKFWSILTIKDIHNQNQQQSIKMIQYMCNLKYKHMWFFLWIILKPIIDLRTFDGGLSNKKHIHIFLMQCCIYKPKFTNDLTFYVSFFMKMQHYLPLNNNFFYLLESLYNFMFSKVISMFKCKQNTHS